jgi:diadenosine tetraphosphate (Ap4A) HIT family hydrolase
LKAIRRHVVQKPRWSSELMAEKRPLFTQYLHIPWKNEYVKKKPNSLKKGECVFCKLVNRDENVISNEIYRNDKALVALNLYPYNPGHCLVIPLSHKEKFSELTEDEVFHVFRLAQKVVKLLEELYHPHGFNIGFNEGKASGASIDHFHIQIVPRYDGDLGFMELLAESRVLVENVSETLQKLKKHAHRLKEL